MDLDLDALARDGWLAVPGVLTTRAATGMAERCAAILGDAVNLSPGDKPAGGTQRTSGLLDRVAGIGTLFQNAELVACVRHLLGTELPLTDVAFRCAGPGFGEQSLHSDDLPVARAGECHAVTAIVALCDFTIDNGATAVVPGSHLRPDLQRRRERLDELILTGAAGTAFVFSAHLLHRGTRNLSPMGRPALQAQWRRRGGYPLSPS